MYRLRKIIDEESKIALLECLNAARIYCTLQRGAHADEIASTDTFRQLSNFVDPLVNNAATYIFHLRASNTQISSSANNLRGQLFQDVL